jgi:uncharacterized membrane protein (UPF0182 family)
LGGRFNYVRNSVKAVIDAYDGTTTLYIVDKNDPIAHAYQKAFPSLFSSEDPSQELRSHFRYPEDLFRVQTNMWGRYHLDNTDDFYTQGPAWSVAPDPGTTIQSGVSNNTTTTVQQENVPPPVSGGIAPYYQLLRLPGTEGQSFNLVRPFVPTRGNNQQMTAFMAANSDPDHYGQLQTFVMPGDRLPPAPTLVASTMGSDTQVSSLQTLLGINTGGSRLFFGNLLIVPIEHSLLYVRPVYVQAAGENNPLLLRKVVVEFNNRVEVADTLSGALKQFPNFSDLQITGPTQPTQPTQPGQQPTQPEAPTLTAQELLARATQEFQAADAALKNGDLAEFQKQYKLAQADVDAASRQLAGDTTAVPTTSTTTPESTTTSTTVSGSSA